jgi:hypothetical protein
MTNPNTDNLEHHTKEVKLLFKHLLLFLVINFGMKFWNMAMFPQYSWSGVIIFIWTIILGVHLLLFFLSTGVFGKEFENVPVKVIAKKLLDMVKDRNNTFKKSMTRQEPDQPNP